MSTFEKQRPNCSEIVIVELYIKPSKWGFNTHYYHLKVNKFNILTNQNRIKMK